MFHYLLSHLVRPSMEKCPARKNAAAPAQGCRSGEIVATAIEICVCRGEKYAGYRLAETVRGLDHSRSSAGRIRVSDSSLDGRIR